VQRTDSDSWKEPEGGTGGNPRCPKACW